MINQIIFDADFFTKYAGISTRSLWTVSELEREHWQDKRDEQIENETNETLYERQADLEELERDNFLNR